MNTVLLRMQVLLRTLLLDVGLFDRVVSDLTDTVLLRTQVLLRTLLSDVGYFDGIVSDLVMVSVVAVLVFRMLRWLCCSCVCC